ncbi:MAG: TRAP transporter substrate-binding protein [Blautia sp.]|nr:TRAP transporter substrate-binding protein [Blautia sp.]
MKKTLALVLAAGLALSLSLVPVLADEAPEYTFKYAELNGDDNINTRVGYKFAEYVDELSEGRIKIDVFSASQLGDEITCLNALQMGGGTVDFYRGNTNSLGDYGIKKMNLFGLPYIFTSRDSMWKVLEDENLGQAFLSEGAEVGAGFIGITYTDEGARHTFTSMEITGLNDLKGKKIRVPETTLMMDTMSALGAEPTPISYSELYSSIQTGVVDGGENGYPGYDSNKFYEVAPYYLLDGHTFSPGVILMAEARWNELSEEDQAILKEAGQKASAWNKEQIEKEEADLRAALEEKGVTIIDVPAEDLAAAQEACQSVWANYSDGVEDELQAILDIQK